MNVERRTVVHCTLRLSILRQKLKSTLFSASSSVQSLTASDCD